MVRYYFKALPKNKMNNNNPNPNHKNRKQTIEQPVQMVAVGGGVTPACLCLNNLNQISLSKELYFLYAFNMTVARRVQKPVGKQWMTSNVRI